MPLILLIQSKGSCQDSATTPVIRTDVREVQIPVVVTDRKDHHVGGLKASDFKVYEDGVLQDIVAFRTAEDFFVPGEQRLSGGLNDSVTAKPAAVKPAAAGTAAKDDVPRRTYLICIDVLHSAFANFGRVRDALGKFFEQEHATDSQYSLIALGREPKIIQDSTREVPAILAAVHDKDFLHSILDSETAKTESETQQFTEAVKKFCAACGCAVYPKSRTEEPYCEERAGRVQALLTSSAERSWVLTRNFLDGLNRLVAATATMPTIRTIVFVSDGYNRFPGRELTGILNGFSPRRSFSLNPHDTNDQLQAIIKLAVQNDIRFYTLDSRGLYTQASLAGGGGFDASRGLEATYRGRPPGTPSNVDLTALSVARENTDGLAQLAAETGGLFYENGNDMLKGIRRAFADGREYYVLAYVPKNTAQDGSYRKISVEVTDKRRIVNAKPGYWSVSNPAH